MEAADEITGGTLLESGEGLVAIGRAHLPKRIPDALEMPGRPQRPRPLGGLRLCPGERLSEGIEPVDGDLRRPLRERRQTGPDPLDDGALPFLVRRHERRDLVDPLDRRQEKDLFLPFEELFARVGHREGIPHALVALGEELLLHLHALQPLRLHVEEVVVVAEIVKPRHDRQGRRQPRQGDKAGMAHHRLEPGVHRHRFGDMTAERTAIDQGDHRGEDEELGRRTEHDPSTGDEPQFGNTDKARQGGTEERHRRRDRAGEDPRADRAARLQERLGALEPAAAGLEVAPHVVGAVIDADADHRHGEGDAQDVQMADGRGRPGEGPRHPDDEHAVGHQGVSHATEAGDDHDHHRCHREPARPDHRLGARPHLVILHHRQPGEADRHGRMAGRHAADQPPQLVGRLRRAGEAAIGFGEPQEDEAHPPLLGEELVAGEIAEGGERGGHPRPGGDEILRARGSHPGCRLEPRHEALGVALERRHGQFTRSRGVARRAEHHLTGEPADHRADFETRPAAVEDRVRFLEEVIDLLELVGGEVMEPLGADAGEIDGVEDGAEEPLVVGHLLRHLLEDADRLRPRRPLDDDHRIVVLAELGDVIDPQLVVVAARIEEIGTVDLVPQATRRPHP